MATQEVGVTIRVLVADDQAMIRGALAGLLNLERDIEWSHRPPMECKLLKNSLA